MKYVVAGSTGLIGKNLINVISKDSETLALTRRNFNFPNNVTEKIVNFDNEYDLPKAEHLFICLGFPVELFDLVIMRKSVKKLFSSFLFSESPSLPSPMSILTSESFRRSERRDVIFTTNNARRCCCFVSLIIETTMSLAVKMPNGFHFTTNQYRMGHVSNLGFIFQNF